MRPKVVKNKQNEVNEYITTRDRKTTYFQNKGDEFTDYKLKHC